MAELETYIPLPQAAVQFGLAEKALRRLVEDGIIRAIQLPGGEVAVSQEGADEAISREEEAERMARELKARFEHLRGTKLGIAEAGRQYGIPYQTISRWVKAGYISELGRDGQKILIDEADVAYCTEVYKRQGGGRGRRIFDDSGQPYILKHPERVRE